MTAGLLAQANAASTGEQITFWVIATVMVLGGLGMVLAKNAVHSALLLAAAMIGFAVCYAVEDAPFLAFVQIIVYTGAIMMLFLFVLMLIGVDSSDSLVETIRGQRVAAVVAGVAFAVAILAGIAGTFAHVPVLGLGEANSQGNVFGVAQLLFDRYVYAFEVTSALLITAALGAMVLAHKERLVPRLSQRDQSIRRFAGPRPSPLPGPGVFARHNAVDTPALLPGGGIAPGSVNHVITETGGPWRPLELSAEFGPGAEDGRLADTTPPDATPPDATPPDADPVTVPASDDEGGRA